MLRSKRTLTTVMIVIALSLICGGLIAVFTVDTVNRNKAASNRLMYEEEVEPLVLKRERLLLEYGSLEQTMLEGMKKDSYLDIVFTELDKQLYDSVFPIFNDREQPLTAMICLSANELPGDDGMISRDEFDIMLDSGWRYAVYWDGEGDLASYISQMKSTLAEAQIAFPNVMVFAEKKYSLEYDTLLSSEEIRHAVHHGEDKLKMADKSTDGVVWHPGALGWNTENKSKDFLNDIIINGGCGMFEVNFSGNIEFYYDCNKSDRVDVFTRFIATISDVFAAGDIEMTTLDNAKDGRAEYLVAKEESLIKVEKRKAQIQEELKVIESEMLKIYKKYH